MLEVIFNFFLTYPEVGYVIVFFAAFFESVAFLGVFVPGTIIVLFSGFVAEQWPLAYDVRGLMIIVALGCFLGAAASYLVGRFYGPPFFSETSFYLKRRYLIRAQQYFAAHGGKSIFSGNFLGPVRSLVTFTAGMSEMRYWRFFSWSIVASSVWAFLYVGLGYFFGASWEAVELWGTRLTVFLFGLALLIGLNWLIGRFLVRHERQVRAFFMSLGRSLIHALLENEYIVAFAERHPRLCRFVGKRFSPYEILGLSFTLSFILSLVILGYLLVLIHAVVVKGPFIGLDNRLSGLVLFVRDPFLNRIMLFVTNLAGLPALGFVVALTAFLIARRAWMRATVFAIGVSTALGLHSILKWIFDRPRPTFNQVLVSVSSSSFPSGHAVIAVVLYGFFAYVLIGIVRNWRTKITVFLATVFLIILVGISRVYLGVHWPSDVLGGYLLGAWWLVVMITAVYLYENFIAADVSQPALTWRFFGLKNLVVIAALIGSLLFYVNYTMQHPLLTVNVGPVEIFQRRIVTNVSSQELDNLTRTTETLRGRNQTPVNIIIVGSRAKFETAFQAAGWETADSLTLKNIFRTIHSSLADIAYPSAPISPSFYEGRVQDIGVEKETAMKSARQRHHARFWLAPIVLADGRDIWLGTASFDSGVAYSPTLKFPTHIISPDIDKERDYIRDDLVRTGYVVSEEIITFSERTIGTSGVGALFFTDGQARVLWLKD